MPVRPNLNQRYQSILKATIRHYIVTAEPVGSKILAEEYNLSVSSATIRSAMGQLEKAGLLYQPHTSAGRIPSDSGYRIYVDELITSDENTKQNIQKTLKKQLDWEKSSIETLLQSAAHILASVSGYIALITMPQTTTTQVKHLQLVSMGIGQILLIVVTDVYQTQSVLINAPGLAKDIKAEVLESELQILSNFLNNKLRGRYVSELNTLDWSELDREFKSYADFLKNLLFELQQRFQPSLSSNTPIMIRGISEVLRQPEFSQLQQVKMLLHSLEKEPERLFPLIFEETKQNKPDYRVKISIGSENTLESMRPCSLVSAIYKQCNTPAGSVGIIGPTRMFYENAIALVESAANYLSTALS